MVEEQNTENLEEAESLQEPTASDAVESAEQAETTDEQAEANEKQKEEGTEDPKKSGFQKRINKITADKHAERKRANDLQLELDAIKARQTQEPQHAPTLEQFDYDEDKFIQAKIDYAVTQKTRELGVQQENSRRQQEQEARQQKYAARVQAANIDGFSDAINTLGNVLFPEEILAAIQED
jgi:hypothetical protein